MDRQRVGIAVSGNGVRVYLPDGRTVAMTLREAAELRDLLVEATS